MKLSEQTIQMVAQAVIANANVLKSLLDSLPKDAVVEVAKQVEVTNPTPVVEPVQAPAPVAVAPAAPEPAPIPTPAPVVTAPPVAPVPAAPTAGACPYNDSKGLIQYVMNTYRELGANDGMKIQTAMDAVGVKNINDTKPEQYVPLYNAIEALRKQLGYPK